jgi:two-component system response regulator (stage 0 sporulation protein A)
MTKTVYPAISQRYSKSPASIEKAIRTALDIAWMRGKVDLLNDIFGFTVNIQKGKPTNSEFIALLGDYVLSCG